MEDGLAQRQATLMQKPKIKNRHVQKVETQTRLKSARVFTLKLTPL